jgi:hypothetical protein
MGPASDRPARVSMHRAQEWQNRGRVKSSQAVASSRDQAALPVDFRVSIQQTRPTVSGAQATLLMYRMVRASDAKISHSTSLLLFNLVIMLSTDTRRR